MSIDFYINMFILLLPGIPLIKSIDLIITLKYSWQAVIL